MLCMWKVLGLVPVPENRKDTALEESLLHCVKNSEIDCLIFMYLFYITTHLT